MNVDDDSIYEIERIIDHNGKGSKRKYLVTWKGYPDEKTWLDIYSFDDTECIGAYEHSLGGYF